MKYYSIDNSDNLKVIGHYPQTEFKKGFNHGTSNSYKNVNPHQFPAFDPCLDITLHKKAIATDYIGKVGVNFGWFVNEKFKVVLEQFNLPPHRFYPIKVYHRAELLDYYWFHFVVTDFWDFLDREKSKAVIYDDKKNFEAIKDLDLNLNPEDYKKLEYFELPYHQNLRWEKIVFKNTYPKYDLYRTLSFGMKIFLSENLVNALNEAGLTGFETKPFDKVICE